MGHFLDIALRVLRQTQRPLSAKDIVEFAIQNGWLATYGKTPVQTMKSKLSTHILKHKDHSLFMRTDKARFGLREWNNRFSEFIADRYRKALLDEDVMVLPATSLFRYIRGTGFHPDPLANGRELLAECRSMSRRVAEEDLSVVQLISVFIVRLNDRYLTYKRTKRLPENRLHGYYSMLFGGHLSRRDLPSLFNIFEPNSGQTWYITRELREEIVFPKDCPPEISYKGVLYDDTVPLSRQHLGIVYDVFLTSSQFQIGERGFLIDPSFETLDEIERRLGDFENWSVLILRYEKGSSMDKERRHNACT